MRRFAAALAFSTLTFSSATAATAQGHDERKILDWYEEELARQGGVDTGARELLDRLLVRTELDAFQVTGATITVPHSQHSAVGGRRMDCGPASVVPSDGIGKAFMGGGGVMIAASSAGGPGAPFIAGIGAVVAGVGAFLDGSDPRSEYAVCNTALVIVPGHYTSDQLSQVRIEYFFSSREGDAFYSNTIDAPIASGWERAHDWARVQDFTVVEEMISPPLNSAFRWGGLRKIERPDGTTSFISMQSNDYVKPDGENGGDCPVTVIAVRLANWSHNMDRRLFLRATIGKDALPSNSCIDVTQINKERYTHEYFRALSDDTVSAYYSWAEAQTLSAWRGP